VHTVRDPTLAWVPPGHFYSPVAPRADREAAIRSAKESSETLAGIDLNPNGQLAMLERLGHWYDQVPFSDGPDQYRYHFVNSEFKSADAIIYACLLQELRPRQVIEVGSGWSSALLLDINETRLGGKTDMTFIEPFPERLRSLARPGDLDGRLHQVRLQSTSLDLFTELRTGDILFIDSTHVSRCGSDVNYLFFELIPNLCPGVYVHIHDVFYPFEYPADWLLEGRSWNESYLTRAFLQFNAEFQIVMFNSYVEHFYREWLASNMPRFLSSTGQSIWLRRRPDSAG